MSYQDRPYTSNPSSSRPVSYGQPYSDHQDPHAPIRPLYHESKDDLDQPFDVRADFDGDGPRWSDVYGTGPKLSDQVRDERSNYQYDQTRDDRSYKPVDSHLPPSGYSNMGKADLPSREELVSVPVLGPEWRKAELHEMTRRGQAEESKAKRLRSWRLFNRDQRGLFGTTWLTRRLIVFSVFFLCIAIGITLFFTLPRAPSFSFYEPSPFVVDNSTIVFSRTPTNFSFNANLNLLADTSSSYLPVHFTNIEASLLDSTTSKIIARGNYGNHKVEKSKTAPVIFPVIFSYSALNTSDSSWNNMYDACGHLWPGTTRPDLKFRLELRMSIIGLVGKKYSQTQLSDIGCPFELPQNGV